MRIISNFHDYYDTVQAAGQDQSLLYVRERRTIELRRDAFPFPVLGGERYSALRMPRGMAALSIVQFVIGFCGRIYPVLRLSYQRRSEISPETVLCYTLSEVDAFMERHFKRREVEAYRSNFWRLRFSSCWPLGQRREVFEEFYDNYVRNPPDFGPLFRDNRCPIFVASIWWEANNRNPECKIVFNESLKELEFFRVLDTSTAFQELQMFLGNMAQRNKPIPEISDKDMVSIKGFDKWSFRKPPEA